MEADDVQWWPLWQPEEKEEDMSYMCIDINTNKTGEAVLAHKEIYTINTTEFTEFVSVKIHAF